MHKTIGVHIIITATEMIQPTFQLYMEYLKSDNFIALFLTPNFERFYEETTAEGFNLVWCLADPGISVNRLSELIKDYDKVVSDLTALFGSDSSEVFRARVSSNFYGRVVVFRREEDVAIAKLANLISENSDFMSWVNER